MPFFSYNADKHYKRQLHITTRAATAIHYLCELVLGKCDNSHNP